MSIYSFTKKNTPLRAIGKAFASLIGLPYYIFSAIVASPMWLTYYLLKSRIRDKAFHNTVGFGVRLSLGNILFIIYAILAFCLLPWPYALAFIALSIPAYRCYGCGDVTVIITVDPQGNVVNAKVLDEISSSDSCLRSFAVRAARLSKFSASSSAPARQNGEILYRFIAQ